MKLSVIVPVYNERATILEVLRRVDAMSLLGVEKEVIVIDDGSTDGTTEELMRVKDRYRVVVKTRNQGKGAAVRDGLNLAVGDIALIQDADLEYAPADYPNLLRPILDNDADVVFGSRLISTQPHRVLYYRHYLGNKFLTILSNLLTNLNLTDMEAGYKVFSRKAVDLLKDKITADRFGIEPQLTALVAKYHLRVYEIGISYYGRTYAEGKKISWKDGVAAIFWIIKYNLFDRS